MPLKQKVFDVNMIRQKHIDKGKDYKKIVLIAAVKEQKNKGYNQQILRWEQTQNFFVSGL